MSRLLHRVLPVLAAAILAPAAAAQGFAADYQLRRPLPFSATVTEGEMPLVPSVADALRLAGTAGSQGAGLSLRWGTDWFGQASLGATPGQASLGLGGGYRFGDQQALSLQLLRAQGPGQGRVGLAVRYDWTQYYLRLSYDRRWTETLPDGTVRFSAGMRF